MVPACSARVLSRSRAYAGQLGYSSIHREVSEDGRIHREVLEIERLKGAFFVPSPSLFIETALLSLLFASPIFLIRRVTHKRSYWSGTNMATHLGPALEQPKRRRNGALASGLFSCLVVV